MVVDLDALVDDGDGKRVELAHCVQTLLGLVERKGKGLLGIVGNLEGHLVHGCTRFLVTLQPTVSTLLTYKKGANQAPLASLSGGGRGIRTLVAGDTG